MNSTRLGGLGTGGVSDIGGQGETQQGEDGESEFLAVQFRPLSNTPARTNTSTGSPTPDLLHVLIHGTSPYRLSRCATLVLISNVNLTSINTRSLKCEPLKIEPDMREWGSWMRYKGQPGLYQ